MQQNLSTSVFKNIPVHGLHLSYIFLNHDDMYCADEADQYLRLKRADRLLKLTYRTSLERRTTIGKYVKLFIPQQLSLTNVWQTKVRLLLFCSLFILKQISQNQNKREINFNEIDIWVLSKDRRKTTMLLALGYECPRGSKRQNLSFKIFKTLRCGSKIGHGYGNSTSITFYRLNYFIFIKMVSNTHNHKDLIKMLNVA